MSCIVCLSSNNNPKDCIDCHQRICKDCVKDEKTLMFVVKKHTICVECKDEVCCYKKICAKCDINSYHMITDNVAVGSCSSNYDEFDVIINLNFPGTYNSNEGEVTYIKKDGKLCIAIGLLDCESKEEEAYKFMIDIIPVLYKYYRNKKILFHCFAGISRSSAFAIAYLAYSLNLSVETAHIIVLDKRKFIEPNKGFLNALKRFDRIRKSLII